MIVSCLPFGESAIPTGNFAASTSAIFFIEEASITATLHPLFTQAKIYLPSSVISIVLAPDPTSTVCQSLKSILSLSFNSFRKIASNLAFCTTPNLFELNNNSRCLLLNVLDSNRNQ